MAARLESFSDRVLKLLPPFRAMSNHVTTRRVVAAHAIVTASLYAVFLILALANGTVWQQDGIGVLQNPPFFAHLAITLISVPLLVGILKRIGNRIRNASVQGLEAKFLRLLDKSRASMAVLGVAFLCGLMSLAASVVMASQFRVDIYDSATLHPSTFAAYTVIRAYQYLICYPILVSIPVVLAAVLFRAIFLAGAKYQPFSVDGLGGLRQYLSSVDLPIYVLQSIATAIAVANYIGWGSLTPVPLTITLGAMVVITAMALALHWSFAVLVGSLRRQEIDRIRSHQSLLYGQILAIEKAESGRVKSLVEEIEAEERLVQSIRKRHDFAWTKYALNFLLALLPQALELIPLALFH